MLEDHPRVLEGADDVLSAQRRRQRLGKAIARYRRQAGLSQGDVAEAMTLGQTTVSAWERGKNTPSVDVLTRLDELFSTGQILVDLWDKLADETTGYATGFANVVAVERAATEIREYAPLYVPGLLQTEEYTKAVLRYGADSSEDVQEQLHGRSHRQKGVSIEEGPRVQYVIEEHVLRRPLGGRKVLHGQLARLLEVAHLTRVSIQVVPMDSEEHPGVDGGYTLYEHPEQGVIAYTESRYAWTPSTDPYVTEGYMSLWADLKGAALPESASVTLIRELQKGLG